MRRRLLVSFLATAVAVVLIAMPAGASRSGPASEAGASHRYLVVYGAGASSAAGRDAITRAGGQVVTENAAIGVAEVTSSDAAFLSDVRTDAAIEHAARDRSLGTARPGMGHKFSDERLDAERAAHEGSTSDIPEIAPAAVGAEPLQSVQWDMQMIHATPDGSYATEPGDPGVLVGVIDTGIDGSHPDIAPNFDAALSRNFTHDIPAIDGPCAEDPDGSCDDPADVDENGHGTHVAGTIAAPINGFGMAGVAPDVTLVNLRAGQDSGYFFVTESTSAITYAADNGIDVVNMSFYIDPWLYNCPSADEYVTAPQGHPTAEELEEQAAIIEAVNRAVDYADEGGVTLIAAAGNGHTDLTASKRNDASSPDFGLDPDGNLIDIAHDRRVTKECLDLPSEAPNVISVSAIGPSGQKADYSNWGIDEVEVAAPGGWFRDGLGTPSFMTPGNMILGPYPEVVGLAEGGIDPETGDPTSDFVVKQCDTEGSCAYYQWIQGTSMASPHAVGVAALIVSAHGEEDEDLGGLTMEPEDVREILKDTATDHRCVPFNYGLVGRTPPGEWNFQCRGDREYNNIYGDGIIDALAAVSAEDD
jgi:subtilisin family serine protease